jgi:hypothetical protein
MRHITVATPLDFRGIEDNLVLHSLCLLRSPDSEMADRRKLTNKRIIRRQSVERVLRFQLTKIVKKSDE